MKNQAYLAALDTPEAPGRGERTMAAPLEGTAPSTVLPDSRTENSEPGRRRPSGGPRMSHTGDTLLSRLRVRDKSCQCVARLPPEKPHFPEGSAAARRTARTRPGLCEKLLRPKLRAEQHMQSPERSAVVSDDSAFRS